MIFEDVSHRRWLLTRRIGFILLVCGLSFGALYLYSSYRSFALPAVADILSSSAPYPWMSTYSGATASTVETAPLDAATKRRAELVTPRPFSIKTLQKQAGYLTVGFLTQSDKASLASFTTHADKLDVVVPDWYALPQKVQSTNASTSTCEIVEQIDEDVRDLLHQKNTAIMPRLSNGSTDRWEVDELRAILRAPERRSCLVRSTANAVRRTDSKGINIDFEGLTAADRPFLTEFFLELTERLHKQQQLLTVDIPVNASAFDLHTLSVLADGIILMAYDQHDPTSRPGPIAAQDWVNQSVKNALSIIPAEKLILGTANYSYDWTLETPNVPAYASSYKSVMQLANDVSAKPNLDAVSQNFHFGYRDIQARRHDVWFLDANTLWNEHRLVQTQAILGASLWRLGLEDPLIWEFFGQTTSGTRSDVAAVDPVDGRSVDHTSEVFTLSTKAQTGHLKRSSSDEGDILAAQYLIAPTSYTTERIGAAIAKNQVVLAFANNLDQTWTPKILNTLDEYKIPAIFYLTNDQVRAHPALVEEVADRGQSIGSTMPAKTDLLSLTPEAINDELESGQRAIISLTGQKTALFQSPIGQHPMGDARVLPVVTRLGYVSMDSNIDLGNAGSLPPETHVQRALTQLTDPDNHIITLHDMDGEQTVTLLNLLIPALQAKGYSFTSIDQAIQIPHERLEPTATITERFRSSFMNTMERLRGKQWIVIGWVFLFTNVLSIVRILFLAVFALRSKHEKKRTSPETQHTPITVVIPAYNEAKTIRRTLASIQNSTHANFVAMVVNDGSTDRTAAIVEQMREKDPRIQLISKPNGGKFSALNLAFQQATTDLIVTIDADTILYPQAIDELIKPFDDPRVDAVCGNVEVGNIRNLLTGFQALEYITSQNFDRRAFEELNCIGVVPGATGAWRRQRVLEIGGYESDTLVEDADVTLRLLKHGGKIVYSPEARSRTEAPATLSDLAKQRLRWSFGTFQCLRKHAGSFFHGTLGWIALPNIFFFQILYPILSPLGDLVFLWAIFAGQVRAIIVGYLFFVLIDFIGSVLAFRLEKRSPKLLLLIFIQRFFYRQFMYVIAFRSIIAILRGSRQSWNKLVREGSVHASFRKKSPTHIIP